MVWLRIFFKLEVFAELIDAWVPIDLTGEQSGFDEENFGSDRLKEQILNLLPSAYRQSLRQIDDLHQSLLDAHQRVCAPVILGHSFLAASAAAIPLPWVDIPVVLAIQSRLAYKLAGLNRQPLDGPTLARISATMGGQVAVQLGVRGALKMIPWVGMAVNSAATFAHRFRRVCTLENRAVDLAVVDSTGVLGPNVFPCQIVASRSQQ